MALAAFSTGIVTQVTAGTAADTITVGATVYTYRATVGATANEIFIGATTTATAQNVFDAINATPAALGVTVGSATVRNPTAKALSAVGPVVNVIGCVPGAIGNLVALATSSASHQTVSGALLTAGSGSLDLDLAGNLKTMQMPASISEVLDKIVKGNEVAPS